METIYDLGKDPMLMHMQRASMSGEGVGLKPTHGIVGSDKWWSHIRRGELHLHTLAGVVSQLWVGRTGDFPEFELASPDGSKSRWLCSVDQSKKGSGSFTGRRSEPDPLSALHAAALNRASRRP